MQLRIRDYKLEMASGGRFEQEEEPRNAFIARVQRYFGKTIWRRDVPTLGPLQRLRTKIERIGYLALRGFVQDSCLFRASALTYITVLSLVPLLAFAFAAAKGFGAMERLETRVIAPFLEENFPRNLSPDEVEEVAEAAKEAIESGAVESELSAGEGTGSEPEAGAESGVAAEPGGEALAGEGAETVGEVTDAVARAAETNAGIREFIDKMLDLVRETDFDKLGMVGLLVLLYTVIKLLSTVERSLNAIWGTRRARSFVRKVSDYFTMVFFTPIFVLSASFFTAAAQNTSFVGFLEEKLHLGPVIELLLRALPLVGMWIGFSFLYKALPNTRTRFRSSLLGGVFAGTLWVLLQWVYVRLNIGTANYNVLYSGFAALPIFLVWLYFSWVIVLLGAELAYAHQAEPDYRSVALSRSDDHAFRELVALRSVVRIGERFTAGQGPLDVGSVASAIGVPVRSVEEALHPLVRAELLAVADGERQDMLLPAKDLGVLTVKDVLDALKGTTGPVDVPARGVGDEEADRVLAELDSELRGSSRNLTLRELVARTQRPAPVGDARVAESSESTSAEDREREAS